MNVCHCLKPRIPSPPRCTLRGPESYSETQIPGPPHKTLGSESPAGLAPGRTQVHRQAQQRQAWESGYHSSNAQNTPTRGTRHPHSLLSLKHLLSSIPFLLLLFWGEMHNLTFWVPVVLMSSDKYESHEIHTPADREQLRGPGSSSLHFQSILPHTQRQPLLIMIVNDYLCVLGLCMVEITHAQSSSRLLSHTVNPVRVIHTLMYGCCSLLFIVE